MAEHRIEKQKETEVKEHDNLVDLHGITIRVLLRVLWNLNPAVMHVNP